VVNKLAVAAGLVGATLSGTAPSALAHPESTPELVNRYITVAAHGSQLELSVARLYGQGPAADLRRLADANADGQISDQEQNELQRQLQQEAAGWLKLRLNGSELRPPLKVSVDLGGQRSTGRHPLVIEGRAPLPVATKMHDVELTPGPPPPRHGETEVMAVLGPGWELVSSRGPGGPKAFVHKPSSTHNGAVGFALRRHAAVNPFGWRQKTLVATALAALTAGLFWWSRRRR
jgi:hypothetical protein